MAAFSNAKEVIETIQTLVKNLAELESRVKALEKRMKQLNTGDLESFFGGGDNDDE